MQDTKFSQDCFLLKSLEIWHYCWVSRHSLTDNARTAWLWRWKHYDPWKRQEIHAQWHSIMSHKTWIFRILFLIICTLGYISSQMKFVGGTTIMPEFQSLVWCTGSKENPCSAMSYVLKKQHKLLVLSFSPFFLCVIFFSMLLWE